jgi:hypothetical protein
MRNRIPCISQGAEVRAASSNESQYAGSVSRFTGMTGIIGHAALGTTPVVAILDQSMDWRHRLLTLFVKLDQSVAATPFTAPHIIQPGTGILDTLLLRGELFHSCCGWDGSSMINGIAPIQNKSPIIKESDGSTATTHFIYADFTTGALKIMQNDTYVNPRGLTYMIWASEQYGTTAGTPT